MSNPHGPHFSKISIMEPIKAEFGLSPQFKYTLNEDILQVFNLAICMYKSFAVWLFLR